ncbi:NAD-dependent epimerase/dehydratase family protein [Agaribacterium sp. ZY112]|uniref:NAD-dependent epimerase/dehydratase family protein n=1 Tax=Agaribacterium sp. ZY112 TaxID=3233574 RepID=UPI0035234351
MTNILVTGASGFVGRNIMQRFSGRDDLNLLGVARRPMPFNNYQQLDLSRGLNVDFSPDVVIHAAAHVSPWGSPKQYQDKNIKATQHVIDFCQQHGSPRLIYLSSSSVFYRDEAQFALTEQSPIGPDFINDYSATKYAGEQLLECYQGDRVILRPRAIFGPGDTVLFPRILRAAKKGMLPIIESQEQAVVGDLIYIDVLADYIIKAALDSTIVGSYNLTNAEPIEFQALLLDVLKRLDIALPKRRIKAATAMRLASLVESVYKALAIKKEPPLTRYGVSVMVHSKTFDVSRMLKDFGPPSVSISEGVDRFIEWQKNHV